MLQAADTDPVKNDPEPDPAKNDQIRILTTAFSAPIAHYIYISSNAQHILKAIKTNQL